MRKKATELAEDSRFTGAVTGIGRNEYLKTVMELEGCDMETAMRFCQGDTDPIDYEYTLGWKLADPIWFLGMFKQPGKKARAKAVENFKKMLCPEELELFEEYCTGDKGKQISKDLEKKSE